MQKRVIRILEYSGNPEWIDHTLSRSIQHEMVCPKGRISSHIVKEEFFAPFLKDEEE